MTDQSVVDAVLSSGMEANHSFSTVQTDATTLVDSRLEFDRLLARLVGQISSNQYKDLNSALTSALSELGKSLKLDRVHLFTFDFARETISAIHEWCNDGALSILDQLQNIPFAEFSWFTSLIKSNHPIAVDDLHQLSIDALPEHDFLAGLGIRSVNIVPMRSHGNLIGLISFEYTRDVHKWQDNSQIMFTILSEVIANAIEGSNTHRLIEINEARERLFIDAIPALIVRIDNHGRVLNYAVGCHGAMSQYVSLHASSVVNSLDDLFERPIADRIFKELAFSNNFKPAKEYEFEITVAGKDITVEMKYTASDRNEGILVFQDISEKKNLERLKNDFINNATHEMRTPLTTILLMIDLMEKTNDADKKAEYWEILKGEIIRERMLIKDLLTISRIEKGKYSGVQKQLDICDTLREAVAAIQPQARGVGIQIREQIPSKAINVVGDPKSFQMVFSNLLSNAIKFSPQKGNIEVKIVEKSARVLISFSDHGIGIPKEDILQIFSRFYRGKNAVKDEIQGSGMGLYIVDHLVREMGGMVTVDSDIGKGTCFTIEMPVIV